MTQSEILQLNDELRDTTNRLIDEIGISAMFLAKRIGISPNTLSQWTRSRHNLKEENAMKLRIVIDILTPLLDLKF
jgi:transcriptional regulator with XRE-family HTH domain